MLQKYHKWECLTSDNPKYFLWTRLDNMPHKKIICGCGLAWLTNNSFWCTWYMYWQ